MDTLILIDAIMYAGEVGQADGGRCEEEGHIFFVSYTVRNLCL